MTRAALAAHFEPARHGHSQAVALSASGLSKSLGADGASLQIFQDISFEVPTGEFLAIVGPSGCGKTTLLLTLAGLLDLDAGDVHLNGARVQAPPAGLAIVFQDYSRSLFPWRRNLANVMFGMHRNTTLDQAGRRAFAGRLLASVGLQGYERYYPWQVSGGMQQRVAIARALAAEPQVLLLDEPLAAVDAQTRADMQDLLLQLARDYRQTCVLVTHDVEEAVYMADRVLVLSRRPTCVLESIDIPLTKPRDQIATRENAVFLDIRHHILSRIRSL